MQNTRLALTLLTIITAACTAYGDEFNYTEGLTSWKQDGSSLACEAVSDKGKKVFVKIDFCTPQMLRVRFSGSEIKPSEEFAVIKDNWDKVDVTVSDQPEQITADTGKLKLKINKNPLRLEVYDAQDRLILAESPVGTRSDKNRYYTSMNLAADEHFFGFGAAAGLGGRLGFEDQYYNLLDKRGQKIDIVGRRVGFFMSTKGYGIFLNSLYPYDSSFRMGCEARDIYSFETEAPSMDYYFIYGPGFKDILGLYTTLTGRTPLVPLWGFGTRQAGYWDQKQTEDYSRLYREKDIPCDVFHLDSNWLNKGSPYEGQGHGIAPYEKDCKGYVDFKWDDRQFPDPNAMIAKLAAANFKFSLWETALVNPNVGPFYEDAAKNNYFVKNKDGSICTVAYGKRGPVAIPDFSNPSTRQWWKQIHKPFVETGVSSFKLDHTGDLGTAKDALFYNGRTLKQMRALHRLLNLQVAFDATKEYTKRRGMIWSSITTAGTQRYPVTWSGDYQLTYEGLAEVVKSQQNMGLSGFGYYAPDMPAERGIDDPNLYIRWVQFGMLNPACQSWCVLPWELGKQAEDIYRSYAKLHYRLLPYIYSYAWQANQTGLPVARSMVLEYQDDPKVYSQDLQYFFGKELLVAPICTKTSSREVYLPAGEWTDYFTGTKYQGPKTITYQSPLDRIPVFVRAGAIIPMGPEVNYVGEKPADPLTLDIYPSGTSSFTLYEDDGISYDYEKGVFAVTDITCTAGSGVITVGIDKKKGEYKTAGRSYILKLNGIGEPNDVAAGGKSLKPCADAQQFESASTGWWYDSVKKTLWAKPGIVKPENGGKVSIIAAKPI